MRPCHLAGGIPTPDAQAANPSVSVTRANVSDGVRTSKALLRLVALASFQNACELYLQIMQELAQLGILPF